MCGAIGTLAEPSFHLDAFKDVPNIYFDDMGTTKVCHQEWRTLIYYSLDDLTQIETVLADSMSQVYKRAAQGTELRLEVHVLNRLKQATRQKNILFHSLGLIKNDRVRRGWLNPIGDLANLLFGTLSQSDAEYYNEQIDDLFADNKRISHLVINQTSILKSAITELNSFETRVASNLHKLDQAITDEVRYRQTLEFWIFIDTLIQEYSDIISVLHSITVNGRHGNIDPLLFDPTVLLDVLTVIEKRVGSAKMIFPVNPQNAYKFLSYCSINIFLLGQSKLCFEIILPIVEEDTFRIYRLIPIPSHQMTDATTAHLHLISLTEYFIILNTETRVYSTMTETEITLCKTYEHLRLCQRHAPLYDSTLSDPCLTIAIQGLIFNEAKCRTSIIAISHNIWIQLYNNQEWIVITPFPERLHVTCNKQITNSVWIQGINKLSLTPGCFGKTLHTTIYSHKSISYEKQIPLTLGLNNATFPRISNDTLLFAHIPSLTKIEIQPHDLTNLAKPLDEIQQEAELISKHTRSIASTESKWNILFYSLYTLGALTIIWIANKIGLFTCMKELLSALRPNFTNCFNSGGTQNVVHTQSVHHFVDEESISMRQLREPITLESPPSHTQKKRRSVRIFPVDENEI